MLCLDLGKGLFALAAVASVVVAVDPSPAERKKWDDKCKAKLGNMYAMVFDSAGQPTGTCRAPPYQGCYWGPYIDPKTGSEGCCGKGNGEFSTDPVATLEGTCCKDGLKYRHDTAAQKGGCCPEGSHMTWDLTYQPATAFGLCCPPGQVTSTDRGTGQNHCCPPGLTYSSHSSGNGECCEPGKTYSFDEASQKGECCGTGQSFKVDAATGQGSCCAADHDFKCDCQCVPSDMNPTCPEHHGKIITNGGKKWKIFCELINHGDNDISTTPGVASWGECIKNCASTPGCVRAIWEPQTKTCHLRSHGNKEDATTADIYSSAHLADEGDAAGSSGEQGNTGNDPVDNGSGAGNNSGQEGDTGDNLDNGSGQQGTSGGDIGPPKQCPDVGGRIVEVGGVTYEIECTRGITDRFADYRAVTTKDVGECMAVCSADPRCQGANLYDEGADEGCVMVKDWEYPASGGVDPTANMMSLVPITKR